MVKLRPPSPPVKDRIMFQSCSARWDKAGVPILLNCQPGASNQFKGNVMDVNVVVRCVLYEGTD